MKLCCCERPEIFDDISEWSLTALITTGAVGIDSK
jgi:hypothetical protein